MMLKFILSLLSFSVLVWAEPSMYANSNGGFYGNNKTITSQNKKEIQRLKQQLQIQEQRIEGLMSVVEGLTASVNASSGRTNTSGGGSKALEELAKMIDRINANYVSKAELSKALKSPSKYKVKTVTAVVTSKKKTSAQHYREGVRNFSKKRYTQAKKGFSTTDEKGYKPAASNYYLGEIAYYTKKYEDAIFHFKKSAGLNDKAGYIDILLLHTAISLERRGEKTQARAFYQNIVENYQGKKSASIAKEKLKKL